MVTGTAESSCLDLQEGSKSLHWEWWKSFDTIKPTLSDTLHLLQSRTRLLSLPTVPPTGNQIFKHMTLWGHSLSTTNSEHGRTSVSNTYSHFPLYNLHSFLVRFWVCDYEHDHKIGILPAFRFLCWYDFLQSHGFCFIPNQCVAPWQLDKICLNVKRLFLSGNRPVLKLTIIRHLGGTGTSRLESYLEDLSCL